MSRGEAEERLLHEGNIDGAFLVRDSESSNHDFSLSIKETNVVKHYRIRLVSISAHEIVKLDTLYFHRPKL